MPDVDSFLSKTQLGYTDNKDIPIVRMLAIEVKRFRSFVNQTIQIGNHVTVFSGRNGTMKTSLMGLIAHPFDSDAKDAFNRPLKTTLKEVFRLSSKFDAQNYDYDLILDTGQASPMREPVAMYYVAENTNRHRIVVSGAEKGDGNFTYNTSFLNLKRLFPLVDTRAKPDAALILSASEKSDLKKFYESILPSTQYSSFEGIHQKNVKTTFAPNGVGATYDWNSISSGEDNLGAIFARLLGFQRAFQTGQVTGNGILCIDEFESSLHPVAQLRLFTYLYKWAQKFKVQVIISTHSLHLIQNIYLKHQVDLDANRIIVNFVSKAGAENGNFPILRNPKYELAYKELTLEQPKAVAESRKLKVYCEDEIAIHFVKRIVKKRGVLNLVEFISSVDPHSSKPGTGYSALKSMCANYPKLMEGSIAIFDADVADAALEKIKDKNLFLRLPDEAGLCIERRIIYFIATREENDAFFTEFKSEKDVFLDQFAQHNISLTPADIANENVVHISKCKGWVDANLSSFKKYVTHYCQTIEGTHSFAEEFLARVNALNSSLGLPMITA